MQNIVLYGELLYRELLVLPCVVLHNVYIEKVDTIPGIMDLAIDPKSNKSQDSNQIADLLD